MKRESMKGIIVAGGTGRRLLPLTKTTNKHLLPVGSVPMICHSISALVESEITDIMIVSGPEHVEDMMSLLGSGQSYGCQLTYKVQDAPNGIVGALKLGKDFAASQPIAVLLADNVFEDSLLEAKNRFLDLISKSKSEPMCMLFLKEVSNPSRFGVATIINGKIIKIVEKPEKPKTNLCVTGLYFYNASVFGFIDDLIQSKRKEYEITDVNNAYIKNGRVFFEMLDGWWVDAGTHASYQEANRLVFLKEGSQDE